MSEIVRPFKNFDFMTMRLRQLVDRIAEVALRLQIGKVFKLDDIVEAHRLMDANGAGGKIFVLT